MSTAAYQSQLANRPSPMVPFVVASIVAHVGIVAVVLVLQWLFEQPRVELEQKPITASLVRKGKKRDEQLLPRKEEAPPPPETAKVAIPTPGVKPEPKVKQTSDKPQPDRKKSLFDALNKTAKPEELEGEEDGDEKGDSAKQEGERYFGVISSAVRRHYDVSNTIAESERIRLTADVLIRLDAEGHLVDVSLTRSSGNDVFDGAVLGAVKKAAPFGPPPPHLKDVLKNKGVPLRFKP
ncbi:MAG: TonB family protein [Myxococcaceae bacterium]|nr:TonB family protein [Myxococcaceae bacterium]